MIRSIRYMAIMGIVLTAVLSLLFMGITALLLFAPGALLEMAHYAFLLCCAVLACYFVLALIIMLLGFAADKRSIRAGIGGVK